MKTKAEAISYEAAQLAEAAHGLISATAEAAGESSVEIRKQLDSVVDRGREIYDRVSEAAVDGARVADEVVHGQPYKSLAVALGVGALLGILLARR